METHKRLLAILHIISGVLFIVVFAIGNLVIQSLLPFIQNEIMDNPGVNDLEILTLVFSLVRGIFMSILVLIAFPSVIGGIALLNGKNWGMVLLLISGCLNLLNVPIGTALGVYTLWVFLESKKIQNNDV